MTRTPRSAPPVDLDRALHADEIEQSLVGACLMSTEAVEILRPLLSAADFYRRSNAAIYEAALALVDRQQEPDVLLVVEALRAAGTLEATGGHEYVAHVLNVAAFDLAGLRTYAGVLREKSQARALVARCNAAVEAMRSGKRMAADVAADLTADATAITLGRGRAPSGFVDSKTGVWEVLEALEAKRNGTAAPLLATGYPELDEPLGGGFEIGELAFFCAVPGGCKTALALNIATNVALDGGAPAAVVSAEMRRQANYSRILSRVSGVHSLKMRKGTALTDDDMGALTRAAARVARAGLWVDDTARPTVKAISAKLHRLKAQNPTLRLVVVDFVQLLGTGKTGRASEDSIAANLTEISYALKGIAKEIEVSAIVPCQVDAQTVERRKDRRPQVADIRWSQAMREAGDFVAMLYRPRVYDPTVGRFDEVEIDVAKARDAEPFRASLEWQGATQRVCSPPASLTVHRGGAA